MFRKNILLLALAVVLAIGLSGCSLISNNQPSNTPVVPGNTNNDNPPVNIPVRAGNGNTNNAPIIDNQNGVFIPAPLPTPTIYHLPVAVSISGFVFAPQTVTVKAGGSVIWTNNDAPPHSIKSDSLADSFNSPTLATGQTFQYVFNIPGTYQYSCGIHPSMRGTVIVE